MRKIFCTVCHKYKSINHYDRDNPVLFCGHVKEISDSDPVVEVDAVYKTIRDEIYRIMRDHNVTYEEAKDILWET